MRLNNTETSKTCQVAAKALSISESSLPIGIPITELKSVYYRQPGESGRSALVCIDGNYLTSHNEVPVETLITAFKGGLRSN